MIGEHDVTELLRSAAEDIAVPAAPALELAAAGRRSRQRRRVGISLTLAAAAAVVAVGVPVLADQRSAPRAAPAGGTSTPPGAHCVDPVPSRLLPVWARTGFSDPRPRIPYVRGDHGDIVAILFAQPLSAPSAADHGNKILWAARVADGSSLHITATLSDGSATVTRVVEGGPGPSLVDLPKPGCWHLTLRWAGRTDSMDLAYDAP